MSYQRSAKYEGKKVFTLTEMTASSLTTCQCHSIHALIQLDSTVFILDILALSYDIKKSMSLLQTTDIDIKKSIVPKLSLDRQTPVG